MKLNQRSFINLFPDLLGLLLLLAVWAVLSLFYPPYILPAPWKVFSAIPEYLTPGIGAHLLVSFWRTLAGFFIALGLGTLFGLLAVVRKWKTPMIALMQALQVLPGTILGVLFLLMFGLGDWTPILLVIVVTLPVLTLNTILAFQKHKNAQEEYLRSIQADQAAMLKYYYVPAMVPVLYSNASLGIGLAVKVIILGEFIGAQNGLGFLLNQARMVFNMREVFFYLSLLMLFTLLFQAVFSAVYHQFFSRYRFGE